MADSPDWDDKLNDSPAIALTGKILIGAIVLLFFLFAFVVFLRFYAQCCWSRREEPPTPTTRLRRRRRRFDFVPGHVDGLRRGLDPAILKSLPLVIFDSKDFKDGLDCAVCISEIADGEKARLLPKCNHWFHADCIDMWFQSHATCPLCRNPVSNQSSKPPQLALDVLLQSPREETSAAVGVFSAESPNFPTNVLFWGNQSRVRSVDSSLEEEEVEGPASSQPHSSSASSSSSSSSSAGNRPDETLVIDIPRQIVDDEEQKSPVPARLRSLKRLLSRGRLNPCSPRADTGQQGGGAQC